MQIPLSDLFGFLHSSILQTREELGFEIGNSHTTVSQSLRLLCLGRDKAIALASELETALGALSGLGGSKGIAHLQEELLAERSKAEELRIKLESSDSARYQ